MSAGSTTVDLLLDDILNGLEGRSGPLDQLVVIGWDNWGEQEWHEATEQAEEHAIEQVAREGRRWQTGQVVRVVKVRHVREGQRLNDEVEQEQRKLLHDLEVISDQRRDCDSAFAL